MQIRMDSERWPMEKAPRWENRLLYGERREDDPIPVDRLTRRKLENAALMESSPELDTLCCGTSVGICPEHSWPFGADPFERLMVAIGAGESIRRW